MSCSFSSYIFNLDNKYEKLSSDIEKEVRESKDKSFNRLAEIVSRCLGDDASKAPLLFYGKTLEKIKTVLKEDLIKLETLSFRIDFLFYSHILEECDTQDIDQSIRYAKEKGQLLGLAVWMLALGNEKTLIANWEKFEMSIEESMALCSEILKRGKEAAEELVRNFGKLKLEQATVEQLWDLYLGIAEQGDQTTIELAWNFCFDKELERMTAEQRLDLCLRIVKQGEVIKLVEKLDGRWLEQMTGEQYVVLCLEIAKQGKLAVLKLVEKIDERRLEQVAVKQRFGLYYEILKQGNKSTAQELVRKFDGRWLEQMTEEQLFVLCLEIVKQGEWITRKLVKKLDGRWLEQMTVKLRLNLYYEILKRWKKVAEELAYNFGKLKLEQATMKQRVDLCLAIAEHGEETVSALLRRCFELKLVEELRQMLLEFAALNEALPFDEARTEELCSRLFGQPKTNPFSEIESPLSIILLQRDCIHSAKELDHSIQEFEKFLNASKKLKPAFQGILEGIQKEKNLQVCLQQLQWAAYAAGILFDQSEEWIEKIVKNKILGLIVEHRVPAQRIALVRQLSLLETDGLESIGSSSTTPWSVLPRILLARLKHVGFTAEQADSLSEAIKKLDRMCKDEKHVKILIAFLLKLIEERPYTEEEAKKITDKIANIFLRSDTVKENAREIRPLLLNVIQEIRPLLQNVVEDLGQGIERKIEKILISPLPKGGAEKVIDRLLALAVPKEFSTSEEIRKILDRRREALNDKVKFMQGSDVVKRNVQKVQPLLLNAIEEIRPLLRHVVEKLGLDQSGIAQGIENEIEKILAAPMPKGGVKRVVDQLLALVLPKELDAKSVEGKIREIFNDKVEFMQTSSKFPAISRDMQALGNILNIFKRNSFFEYLGSGQDCQTYLFNRLHTLFDFDVKGIKNFMERYEATFGGFRDPGALYAYLSSISFLPEQEKKKVKEEFEDYVKAVLEGRFPAIRYETGKSPHLNTVFEDPLVKELWLAAEPPKKIGEQHPAAEQAIDYKEFFKTKILRDQHLKPDDFPLLRDYLTEGLQAEKTGDTPKEQFQALAVALCEGKENPAEFVKKVEKLGLDLGEFTNDLKALVPQKSGSQFVIAESDDACDLLLIGTEVRGSCQRVNGTPSLNKCLVSYLMNGEIRAIVVKTGKKIAARSMLRLMWDSKNAKPVLLLERIYSNVAASMIKDEILEWAKRKAKNMGISLVSKEIGKGEPYPGTVSFSKGFATYLYSDAAGGIRDTPFETEGCHVLSH